MLRKFDFLECVGGLFRSVKMNKVDSANGERSHFHERNIIVWKVSLKLTHPKNSFESRIMQLKKPAGLSVIVSPSLSRAKIQANKTDGLYVVAKQDFD